MRLSRRQRVSLLAVGIYPESWDAQAIAAFFALTDRGQQGPLKALPLGGRADFEEVYGRHRFREVTECMWAEDFRKGLLFLVDFCESPPEQVARAESVYQAAIGPLPSCWRGLV